MSDNPLVKRIAQTAEAHGLGWIDNGTDTARCYCGHRPRLGESWHWHVADALIRELELHRELEIVKDRAQPRHRYVTDWTADEYRSSDETPTLPDRDADVPDSQHDLRTRIADCCGVTSVDLSDSDRYAVADAVIRELQLTVLGDGIVVGVIHE